jgi:hypothetical protein
VLIVRWLVLALLASSAICFVLFAVTGNVRYKRVGLVILKWTVFAALGFFAVLIVERLR